MRFGVITSVLVLLFCATGFAQEPSSSPISSSTVHGDRDVEHGAVRGDVYGATHGGTQGVRRGLERAGGDGARVVVTETPGVQAVMSALDARVPRQKMMVYSVRIFLGNSQSAGPEARSIAGRFAEMFPEHPPRVSYESPYFKVAAGRFVDRTDAVALCGKVAAHFPRAFVVQEEVGTRH